MQSNRNRPNFTRFICSGSGRVSQFGCHVAGLRVSVPEVSHRSSRRSFSKRTDTEGTAISRDGFVIAFGASFHVNMELLDEKAADHLPGCEALSDVSIYPGQRVLGTVSFRPFYCCSVY